MGAETRTGFAHAIDGGDETGGAGAGKHGGGGGTSVRARGVEGVEQQEIAEVKNLRVGGGKIKVRGGEQGVGAALVEKRAARSVAHRHHIGVAGGGFTGGAQLRGRDAVGGAVGENGSTIGVVADEAHRFKGKRGAEAREILEQIVGGAAVAVGLGEDGGEGVLGWPRVDEFDVVDDPVAAGEDSVA